MPFTRKRRDVAATLARAALKARSGSRPTGWEQTSVTETLALMPSHAVSSLANTLVLGALLDQLLHRHRGYELLAHWKQGEFHHDLVVRVRSPEELPGDVLVIATNCNGGVKELLCFAQQPDRDALWHARCPDNPEFGGQLSDILAEARTLHWFDPCELLLADARSEMKPECRRRQRGGGFEPVQ
jgi:hypothetical protein